MSTSNPTSSQAAAPASQTAPGILIQFVAVIRRVKYITFAVGAAATCPRTPCIVHCVSAHLSTKTVDLLLELSILTRELFNDRRQFLVGVDQFFYYCLWVGRGLPCHWWQQQQYCQKTFHFCHALPVLNLSSATR